MGASALVITLEGSKKMKQFALILLAASSLAKPQGYGYSEARCQTTYVTEYETQCKTVTEPQCSTVVVTEYQSQLEKKCEAKLRTSYQAKTEQRCSTKLETTYEAKVEKKCLTKTAEQEPKEECTTNILKECKPKSV